MCRLGRLTFAEMLKNVIASTPFIYQGTLILNLILHTLKFLIFQLISVKV